MAISSLITDDPTLENALDFASYSKQLADIIRFSTPRFVIGVFGGWGIGKTSLMKMIEANLKKEEKDILTVWFNAWKYQNEKYLAVVPFLRTIKITLDNDRDSKSGRWDNVRGALNDTFWAFTQSTNISLGMGSYGSTQIDLSKFTDVLRAHGSAKVSGEAVYYYKHVTDYLQDSLLKLREKNSNSRIVVFIDDLDRCHPKQALEVLATLVSRVILIYPILLTGIIIIYPFF